MCGLKLGTEAVKKLGKKKTVKLCVRGMLTKSSSCCHAICICCSISKLAALDYKRNWVCCHPSGRHKAWDEAAGLLRIGFTGRMLHGVHLGLKEEKTCLKPVPGLNTTKHRSHLWAALLSLPLALPMPVWEYWCCLLQCFILPVPAKQLKWRLAPQTCFFLLHCSISLCLTLSSVLVLLVVATLWAYTICWSRCCGEVCSEAEPLWDPQHTESCLA